MRHLRFAALLALALAPSPALAEALESLKCIPDLPYSRIASEFSALLDKPECADVQVRANVQTHLLFVRDCRPQRADWSGYECKTFNFQINNATTETPLATGARFYLKGSAKWCRAATASHAWAAAEPEVINQIGLLRDGPALAAYTCHEPSQYRLAGVAPTQPATPLRLDPPVVQTPVVPPPPIASAPIAPAPPVAKCAGGYRLVCSDLATLRYLARPDASDAEFGPAARAFLSDERDAAATGAVPPPMELGRLSAAAVARSTVARGCARDKAENAAVAACGKVM